MMGGATYIVDDSLPSQVICPRCEGYGCNDLAGGHTEDREPCTKECHRDWNCWLCHRCGGLGWVAAPMKRIFFNKNTMPLPKTGKKILYGSQSIARPEDNNQIPGMAGDLSDDSWGLCDLEDS